MTVQQLETAKMARDLATAEESAAESALKQARVHRDVASASRRKTEVRAPFDAIVLECDLVPGQMWGGIAPAAFAGGSLAAAAGRAEASATALRGRGTPVSGATSPPLGASSSWRTIRGCSSSSTWTKTITASSRSGRRRI